MEQIWLRGLLTNIDRVPLRVEELLEGIMETQEILDDEGDDASIREAEEDAKAGRVKD